MIEEHLTKRYGPKDGQVTVEEKKVTKKKKSDKEEDVEVTPEEMLQRARDYLGYDVDEQDPEYQAYKKKMFAEKRVTKKFKSKKASAPAPKVVQNEADEAE